MSYHTVDVWVECLEPDEGGFVRARLAQFERPVAVGEIVSVCDDEMLEFARVERLEGDPVVGTACLTVLAGAESEQVARARSLDADWCQDE
jgi:hypothetical protein